jgi:hypothetical protein
MPRAAEMAVEAWPAPKASWGEELVDVGLVADVPDEEVARRIEDVVEGDGQLDSAEGGAEVTTVDGDDADQLLPQLGGEAGEVGEGAALEVGRGGDLVEDRHRVGLHASSEFRVPSSEFRVTGRGHGVGAGVATARGRG